MKKPELLVNLGGIIAEGICWDEKDKMLYWIDLLENKIFAYNIKNPTIRIINVNQNTGCVRVREQGGLIAGLQNGIFFVDVESGKLTPVADPESDKPGNRFNDGTCDCMGRFWAGTMSKALDSGSGDLTPRGSLYCVGTDYKITRKLDNVIISNGIGYSKDNSTMYYIDSPTREVAAFDFEKESGEISNKRSVVKIPEEIGMPDGMAVDAEGKLWVAMWGGGAVVRYDPDNGRMLEKIDIPVKSVTSLVFGGDDMDEMYVTTARMDTDLNMYPDAGGVFKIKMDVKGQHWIGFS
jgi:sugar lactone lactonase YvrE